MITKDQEFLREQLTAVEIDFGNHIGPRWYFTKIGDMTTLVGAQNALAIHQPKIDGAIARHKVTAWIPVFDHTRVVTAGLLDGLSIIDICRVVAQYHDRLIQALAALSQRL